MINKTIFRGIKNLIFSKNNRLNILQNYFGAFLKTPFSSHPLEIQVEPSAVCNLKCRMCSLKKSTEKKKFLTSQELLIIIEKFRPNSINLTGMGETLLNPYFENLLKICFNRKIKTSFITNIQSLNEKHLKAIKKYPPSIISISMETGYPKKYNQIRCGAEYKTTVLNIQKLQNFIKNNSLNTEIYINIVFHDFNLKYLDHLKKIIRLASKLNIKKITSQNINTLSHYIKKLYQSQKIILKFNELKEYAKNQNIELVLPSTHISKGKCYYPWVYPQITATGEILPCCVIPQFGNYNYIINKYSFGNIINDSFINTWNGRKAISFRKNYQKDNFCRICTKNQGVL